MEESLQQLRNIARLHTTQKAQTQTKEGPQRAQWVMRFTIWTRIFEDRLQITWCDPHSVSLLLESIEQFSRRYLHRRAPTSLFTTHSAIILLPWMPEHRHTRRSQHNPALRGAPHQQLCAEFASQGVGGRASGDATTVQQLETSRSD